MHNIKEVVGIFLQSLNKQVDENSISPGVNLGVDTQASKSNKSLLVFVEVQSNVVIGQVIINLIPYVL